MVVLTCTILARASRYRTALSRTTLPFQALVVDTTPSFHSVRPSLLLKVLRSFVSSSCPQIDSLTTDHRRSIAGSLSRHSVKPWWPAAITPQLLRPIRRQPFSDRITWSEVWFEFSGHTAFQSGSLAANSVHECERRRLPALQGTRYEDSLKWTCGGLSFLSLPFL